MFKIEINNEKGKLSPPQSPTLKTRFHDNPVLCEWEIQAIKAGLDYTEFKEEDGWEFKGKCRLLISKSM